LRFKLVSVEHRIEATIRFSAFKTKKFGQPFQRLWVLATPTKSCKSPQILIAKHFAVLRLEHKGINKPNATATKEKARY